MKIRQKPEKSEEKSVMFFETTVGLLIKRSLCPFFLLSFERDAVLDAIWHQKTHKTESTYAANLIKGMGGVTRTDQMPKPDAATRKSGTGNGAGKKFRPYGFIIDVQCLCHLLNTGRCNLKYVVPVELFDGCFPQVSL